jgi:hypothetical protein
VFAKAHSAIFLRKKKVSAKIQSARFLRKEQVLAKALKPDLEDQGAG